MGDVDRLEKGDSTPGIEQEIAKAEAEAKVSQRKLQDLKLKKLGLKVTECPVNVTVCVPRPKRMSTSSSYVRSFP